MGRKRRRVSRPIILDDDDSKPVEAFAQVQVYSASSSSRRLTVRRQTVRLQDNVVPPTSDGHTPDTFPPPLSDNTSPHEFGTIGATSAASYSSPGLGGSSQHNCDQFEDCQTWSRPDHPEPSGLADLDVDESASTDNANIDTSRTLLRRRSEAGDSPMKQWLEFLPSGMRHILAHEEPRVATCVGCHSPFSDSVRQYKCLDCFGCRELCKACLADSHPNLPFHRAVVS